jgi:hypothetical protein
MASLRKPPSEIGAFVRAGLIGGIIAFVINLVLYFLGNALNSGPLMIKQPGTGAILALPIFAVAAFSIAPGLIAGGLFGLLKRFSAKARVIFLVIAVVIFALFFMGPFGAAQSTVTLWILQLMHLGTAIPVIAMILKGDR